MIEHEALPQPEWEQRNLGICFERAWDLQIGIDQAKTDDELKALYAENINVLDKMFPYYGQPVHISGRGLFPYSEDNEIQGEGWGTSEGVTGIHEGFDIVQTEEDETGATSFRVMQRVYVGEFTNNVLKTVGTTRKIYHFYDLGSQLFPIVEMEAMMASHELSSYTPDESLNTIFPLSSDFVNLLRSTEFRRLKHKQQKRIFDEVLMTIDQHTMTRGLTFTGEPSFGYVPSFSENNRYFMPLALGAYVISGQCLGIDSLETTALRKKAIRRDKDMASKYAGLCIVIDPDKDTRQGLYLADDQVLYIPTNNQDFDAVLYTED